MAQTGGEQAERESTVSLILSHVPLLVSAMVFGTLFVRLLVAAHGSPTSAFAILESGGIAQVVIGALVTSIGAAFLIPWMLSATELMNDIADGLPYKAPLIAATALAILVALLAPWGVFATGIVVMAVAALRIPFARRKRQRRKERRDPDEAALQASVGRSLVIFTAAVSIVVWIFVVTSNVLWLPAEVVVVGRQPHIGYVLSEQGAWTTLLRDDDRKILQVQTADVRRRTTCVTSQGNVQRTLPVLILGLDPPRYPKCSQVARVKGHHGARDHP